LIAEGFLPPPHGGRANADYGVEHVNGIKRYSRLRELGFPPAAIKVLLETKEGAPFPVAPGLTLIVDPALIGSGLDAGPLVKRIVELLNELLRSKDDRKYVKPKG
jgi:hypothetical protein